MERLEDILAKDLETVFTYYRDFTGTLLIQTGTEKLTVWGSLQADKMQMNAEATPVNAYSETLLVRDSDLTTTFKNKLSQDSIIYIEGVAYRVVDTSESGGIYAISLTKGTKRGKGLSCGREI